ncbi:MAG: aldo/keto reductase [Thermoplasmata archaeon]|nr:aldo/keto reductase [Thermoplasmata archaeon]MCI4359304.1 aldo/keto reductase [Thermoplasmata archaeon]
MPVLGLGVWQTPAGIATEEAVRAALRSGYRLIDTAAMYGNESDVGRAIRHSSVPREELFVTTKLWNDDQGYEGALAAFERSRSRLGVSTVDLYLIHWPVPGKREESWRALTQLQQEGRARAIGVSNFTIAHLEALARVSEVTPAVNQVEFSPFLFQAELLEYCCSHGIQLEAYSPLVRGRRLDHPVIGALAAAHGKSPAQVVLRWDLQHGVIPIPKSTRPERIQENSQLFDFELGPSEMAALDGLDEGLRMAWDPSEIG